MLGQTKCFALRLTFIIFIDGHDSWLQDADLKLLVDLERDFFRALVRDLWTDEEQW